jgi:hypothetical protein
MLYQQQQQCRQQQQQLTKGVGVGLLPFGHCLVLS